jgi:hypothetical protein
MKIAFLGNFSVDFSSESHYLKTFQKLGHEVITFQEGERGDTTDHIFAEAQNCDIFFWVHTHGWENKGVLTMNNMLKFLKERNIPFVGYHLDLWLGIERQKDLELDLYWKALDYFFCTDALMVDWLNERKDQGYPKAFFLPAGVFEDECYLGTPREDFKFDVVFTGSVENYHPEWPYRKVLVDWLKHTYGNRFAHFGNGGREKLRGKDLNDLYASAKIVIGDTLCKNFNYPYYLSDRVFEVTGRGGFLIMPYIQGLETSFILGIKDYSGLYFTKNTRQIATYPFNNFEYLKYQIDYFLKNDDEREEIRLAGHQRTKRDHTYTNRLSYLLGIVQYEQRNSTHMSSGA